MARTKQRGKVGKSAFQSKNAPVEELPSDMEDEVEKFHKRKDKLSLTVSDDEIDEDSLDEEVGLATVQCGETWV